MLTLDTISKRYGERVILKDISASFDQGSLAVLTGRNGSGKTTLLKIMAGLTKPSSGTVDGLSEDDRVAYVAHATFLYPALTAYENLAFWNRCMGSPKSRDAIYDVLESVGLLDFSDEYARTFSRGMAQRLNLARALLFEPGYLFLDEPMTGLDTASRELFREKLVHLRERGACIVLVSHTLDEDAVLATQIYHLENGLLSSAEVPLCGQ
ncbi:MAG: heme ABC exporter ATP-binding protein CcmA [Desulfovibrionaceae bacterium]|nr:heme ABC exporter ATP-binding protein CcmA [Desulfovibrionaceae bacterium]